MKILICNEILKTNLKKFSHFILIMKVEWRNWRLNGIELHKLFWGLWICVSYLLNLTWREMNQCLKQIKFLCNTAAFLIQVNWLFHQRVCSRSVWLLLACELPITREINPLFLCSLKQTLVCSYLVEFDQLILYK